MELGFDFLVGTWAVDKQFDLMISADFDPLDCGMGSAETVEYALVGETEEETDSRANLELYCLLDLLEATTSFSCPEQEKDRF